MQALTSDNPEEISTLIDMLENTDAGTGFMHESFHPNNPEQFTRHWFAWPNSLFGELIYKAVKRNLYKREKLIKSQGLLKL